MRVLYCHVSSRTAVLGESKTHEWAFPLSIVAFRLDLLKMVIIGCPFWISTWICILSSQL